MSRILSKLTTPALMSLLAIAVIGPWRWFEMPGNAASGCATANFAAIVTPNISNTLNSVAVGDLNADGKPDLVTTSYSGDTISILIGDGTGKFTLSSTITTGPRPKALALEDFNQDGKLDLAVSRDFSTTVSILLGTGAGTFSAPTNLSVGTNPLVLVLADFNTDGKIDLATGNDGSNTISIMLGNGAGGFSPGSTLTGIRAPSIAVADFNGDGKADLVAANNANAKVSVVLGDGSGGFGPANNFDGGSDLQAIAAADFNGDGHPDIAVTNFSHSGAPDSVAILLGDGAGLFGAPNKFSVPAGPLAIAVADFNGDGLMDVATANIQQSSSNVAVLLGNGMGVLGAPTPFSVGTTPNAIVAKDINLDGIPDMVVTSPPNVATLLNACGGAPTPTPTPTPVPSPTPTPVPTPRSGDVVISQIYSGAGNADSVYQGNYLELFNRTDAAIDIGGWPIYFTSATGTFQAFIAFVNSRGIFIQPHRYLLIKFGPVGSNGLPLSPDLDASSSPPFSISPSGKIFLAKSRIPDGSCPLPNPNIIDFVGYGSANCFEGVGSTAITSNSTAALRRFGGCIDSDNNASDFQASSPNPRNSSSPANLCTNAIDDTDFFVRQHYLDFLNRQADPAGLTFWENEITSCTGNSQCVEIKRINVSAAFYLSIEFQDTGYLVERIYKAAYGDTQGASTLGGLHQLPVPIVRLSEFLPDTQEIGQGVIVGQAGWETVLENNKQAFTTEFVQRSRFTTAFPNTMTPAQFVDTLNANAGTPLSPAERNQLVNDLATSAKTRAQVLRAVAEDSDLVNAEFNRAFVLMQFFGYLRRNPNDAPDSDYTGYDFWLTKLNQFNGNFQNAEMVKAFISSLEYRQRFGP